LQGKEKLAQVRSIGADRVIARDDDIVACLGEKSVDVVVDNVAGPAFGGMLKVLKRGGNMRPRAPSADHSWHSICVTFYLKDLTLIGCTAWDSLFFQTCLLYREG
jgi:NADPH:quinone reductase-like Zn-dependent oxidoreductase